MNTKPSSLIRTMFLRNQHNHPIGCLAICVDRDSNIAQYQYSVLNPMDRFDRKLSRVISKGRLVEEPITVKLDPQASSMHDISTLIMRDIVARGIAPSRAVKAAKLWLSNLINEQSAEEQSHANVLADFTTILNKYGVGSPQVERFRNDYDDDRMQGLFDTAIRLQRQLQQSDVAQKKRMPELSSLKLYNH